jgi:Cu/Ag efflux protein CusF
MKTKTLGKWAVVCASVMTLTAFQSPADPSATAAKPVKNYTGTVVSVNSNERTVKVKGFLLSHRFNLGTSCAYVLLDNPEGAISDVRPGEKVKVAYQDVHGVLVADRLQQEAMDYSGMVKAIDPATHTITLHSTWTDKTFRIPDDCKVVLRGDKTGALANIQTGDHVTVTYEIPKGKATARQIAQTSEVFTGSLAAVDTTDRTVKAKTLLDSKTFHLADNCAIVVNGKPDGRMDDLKLGSRLAFSYDDVNGVNVVNRIGPVNTPSETGTETTSAQPVSP